MCRGTHRLLEAALASTANDGGSAAELGSAGVASALPPRYVDFKEAIRSEMTSIKQKMGDLRALHGKAALTTFDDTNSHDMDIEVLTQEITRLFRKAEIRLQQSGGGACTSEADEKVSLWFGRHGIEEWAILFNGSELFRPCITVDSLLPCGNR